MGREDDQEISDSWPARLGRGNSHTKKRLFEDKAQERRGGRSFRPPSRLLSCFLAIPYEQKRLIFAFRGNFGSFLSGLREAVKSLKYA
jgi:hypothetical protein